MAQIPQVPPIPGVKEALGLLAFIEDPEKYGGYLRQLVAMRDEVNALVAAYGTVTEVEHLAAQAKADRQMAAETLAAAKTEAARLRAEARAAHEAAAMFKTDAEADLQRQRAAVEAAAAQLRVAQDAHALAVVRDRERAAATSAALEAARQQADTVKADYEAKRVRLEAARATLEADLGR